MASMIDLRHRGRTASKVIVGLTCLALVLGSGAFSVAPWQAQQVVLAAGTPCVTSGPASNAYTIRVCITAPVDGTTLIGDVPVSASVTTVSGTSPGVGWLRFYLSKQSSTTRASVLTDYLAPYTFTLRTNRWVDGAYRLEVQAMMTDGFTAALPATFHSLVNGVTVAPSSANTWTPKSATGSPLVVAAVGDGAGGLPGADNVANLIGSWNPGMLLYLGDVYNTGSYTEFYNYYTPTLGRFAGITNSTPGNHEQGKQLKGYFDYWDTTRHWYSYDAAGWHFISIDSTSEFNQTVPGTAQYDWLAQDIQANAGSCTVVFDHHPRFGLTATAGNAYMDAIWSLMVQNKVDLFVTGHEHNYQRWQPMDATGAVAAGGLTQFVVGTGGHEQYSFGRTDSRVATRVSGKDGALRLTLGATDAGFAFVDTSGATLDSGSVPCVNTAGGGNPTPTPTPPVPTPTPTVTAALPFVDDFETGNLSKWTRVNGLVDQQAVVASGAWAARGTSTGTVAYARKDVSPGQNELYYRVRVNTISQGATSTVILLRMRSATDVSILSLYVGSNGRLTYRNDATQATTVTTAPVVTKGVWHEIQVHVRIADTAGLVEVWYDGVQVASKTEALGVTPIGRIQLGETATAKTFDFAFDDVAVDSQCVGSCPAAAALAAAVREAAPTPTPSSPGKTETLSPTASSDDVSPTPPAPTDAATVEPTVSKAVGAATVRGTDNRGARCRTGASTDTEIITVLEEGTRVRLTGAMVDGWYPVRCHGQDGFIRADLLRLDGQDQAGDGDVVTSEPPPTTTTVPVEPTPAMTAAPTTQTPPEAAKPAPPDRPTPYHVTAARRSEHTLPSALALDGDRATVWSTDGNGVRDSAVLILDLGTVRPIGTIRWLPVIKGAADGLRIRVSDDGERWQTVAVPGPGELGVWHKASVQVAARYVRVSFSNPNQQRVIGGLAEIEIWPAPGPVGAVVPDPALVAPAASGAPTADPAAAAAAPAVPAPTPTGSAPVTRDADVPAPTETTPTPGKKKAGGQRKKAKGARRAQGAAPPAPTPSPAATAPADE